MKKLLVSLMLIFALSVPVFSGHVPVGGGRYCGCNPVGDYCPCCNGNLTVAHDQENDSINQKASDGAEPTIGHGVIQMAFLMWLKIRA